MSDRITLGTLAVTNSGKFRDLQHTSKYVEEVLNVNVWLLDCQEREFDGIQLERERQG